MDIVFHSDVDPNAIREKLAAIMGLAPQDINPGRRKVRLTVPEKASRSRRPR